LAELEAPLVNVGPVAHTWPRFGAKQFEIFSSHPTLTHERFKLCFAWYVFISVCYRNGKAVVFRKEWYRKTGKEVIEGRPLLHRLLGFKSRCKGCLKLIIKL
jgi:hypothetical protein